MANNEDRVNNEDNGYRVWMTCMAGKTQRERDCAYVKVYTSLDREFCPVINAHNTCTPCLDKCLGRESISSET